MVAPVFILILIGILVYGIYFGTALSVTQIAAEAARASVGGLNNTERTSLAENKAEAMIRSYGFLSADRMTVVAAPQADDADVFDVAVTYDASNLPIYAFDGLLPIPPAVITRRSSIQRGGF